MNENGLGDSSPSCFPVAEKSIVYARDQREHFIAPAAKDPVPYFNFSPLQNAVTRLRENASSYGKATEHLNSIGTRLPAEKRAALDRLLLGMERRLTLKEGLPGRPWYTHQIYAPGFYTGYGVKTLPAIRESIEQRKWDEVDRHIGIVSRLLSDYSDAVSEATVILSTR